MGSFHVIGQYVQYADVYSMKYTSLVRFAAFARFASLQTLPHELDKNADKEIFSTFPRCRLVCEAQQGNLNKAPRTMHCHRGQCCLEEYWQGYGLVSNEGTMEWLLS